MPNNNVITSGITYAVLSAVVVMNMVEILGRGTQNWFV